LLEIGCGWGALSLYAAKKTGCRVTGITVSEQQLKYCRDLLKRETELDRGLAGRVNFELVDYRVFARTRPRQFTRIISCEMLEAVGHEYLGDFFKSCEQLLTPEGLLVVQVITFPDHRYDAYRKSVDFIREYIFPGGLCPSNAALTSAMQKSSNFHVENLENIGPHYATTLSLWRERFWDFLRQRQVMDNGVSEVKYSSASGLISESKSRRRASAVAPLHAQRAVLDDEGNELPRGRDPTRNDRFVRMWHYYYVYCEAAFATRTLGTLQIVYSRQHNSSLA
jgi:cyclopropane-fatty-acyl-phospholipid synthase